MKDIYETIKKKMLEICESENLLTKPVQVRAKVLSPKEAIGNPEADDFPLQKGKERLMQAAFFQSFGQAFTDQYGDFEGTLENILKLDLKNNFRRAIFVSTINAVLRHLNRIDKTTHCKDREPTECAVELASYLKQKYGKIKLALIGFQPRMVESLSTQFLLRVLDRDNSNIGAQKFQVSIEGPEKTREAFEWADLLVVTGTTIINGTITNFLGKKPLIFYGTTIAGAAHLMNWERFCARGH